MSPPPLNKQPVASGTRKCHRSDVRIVRSTRKAGSSEPAIRYLLHARRRSQLWYILEKQHTLTLQLNQNLNRALYINEKWLKCSGNAQGTQKNGKYGHTVCSPRIYSGNQVLRVISHSSTGTQMCKAGLPLANTSPLYTLCTRNGRRIHARSGQTTNGLCGAISSATSKVIGAHRQDRRKPAKPVHKSVVFEQSTVCKQNRAALLEGTHKEFAEAAAKSSISGYLTKRGKNLVIG